MKKILPVLCTWMILLAASACSAARTTQAVPEDKTSAAQTSSVNAVSVMGAMVTGIVENIDVIWPERAVTLFAATFTGATESEGYFVLEPDQNPHTEVLEDGTFTLLDIPAGQYILLAGPTAEEARKLYTAMGEAVIIQIEDGQQIVIGNTFLPD